MPEADLTNLDDENLVRLVSLRHTAAFRELYGRYGSYVYGLAVHITGDAAVAEEITQEVFFRLWERAWTYRAEQARVKTWLLSIARHRAIDVLRRRKVRPEQGSVPLESALFLVADESNVEQDVAARLKRERIQSALARLPPEQRQVIILAYYFGFSQSQIAEREGRPIGTIKTRTRLAMQKLRAYLDATEEE